MKKKLSLLFMLLAFLVMAQPHVTTAPESRFDFVDDVGVGMVEDALNLTTTLIQKFDGFGNLQTWVKNLDEIADAQLLAKLNDLDKGYFEKLDVDLADATFKNAIENKHGLVGAWEVLNDGPEVLRTNPENIEKLAKFISETGMEKSKLIGSFGNTKNPKKWIQMKISESELDAIYDRFRNSPPAKQS